MLLKLALCVFFSMFNQSKPQPALVFRFSTNKLFVLECETRRYRLVEFTCSDVGSMRSDQRLQPLLYFFRLSWVSSRITHTHTHTHTQFVPAAVFPGQVMQFEHTEGQRDSRHSQHEHYEDIFLCWSGDVTVHWMWTRPRLRDSQRATIRIYTS